MTIKSLTKKLKLDWQNSDINDKNFPDTGRLNKDFKVFHFGKTMSSDAVIAEMAKEGYEPANLRELLTHGFVKGELLVALGQSWRGFDGYRFVPFLSWIGQRELDLDWYDYDWDDCFRFLAVRKSLPEGKPVLGLLELSPSDKAEIVKKAVDEILKRFAKSFEDLAK